MSVVGAYLLGAAGQVASGKLLRLALGAAFRPSTGVAVVSGILAGPANTQGELTLLSNTQLTVQPFRAVIQNTTDTTAGQYLVPNDAAATLGAAQGFPAQDAAQFRRAYVLTYVDDAQVTGSGANQAYLTIIGGPLAATAGAATFPAVPNNALLLGELLIPPTGQTVTLTPYNPRTVVRGQSLSVANAAARLAIPTAQLYDGFSVIDSDTGRRWRWWPGGNSGAGKWTFTDGPKPYMLAYGTNPGGAGQTVPITTWVEVQLADQEMIDTDNAHDLAAPYSANSRFIAPFGGYYRCTGGVVLTGTSSDQGITGIACLGTNGRHRIGATAGGFPAGVGPVVGSAGEHTYARATVFNVINVKPSRVWLDAGQFVSLWIYTTLGAVAARISDLSQITHLEVTFDGD